MPLTKDLKLLSYTGYAGDDQDSEDEIQGLLLIYHDFTMVYALEELLSNDPAKRSKQRDAFENLKSALCSVLLGIHDRVNF